MFEDLIKELPEELTVKRIARALEVSLPTIRNEIQKGHLKAIKIKRQYSIKKADFVDYLNRFKGVAEIEEQLKEHSIFDTFSLAELANLFKVAYITAYRWVCVYLLIPGYIGGEGQVLVPPEGVKSFIEKYPGKVVFSNSGFDYL